MIDSARTSDTIAGYRVIRKLGTGSRSDVFLGVGDADTDGEPAVALKVFHPQTPLDSINRELAIVASLSNAHTVALLDVATGPDGRPVAVLARISGSSLAHVLTTRAGSLAVGEAITVLAPLAGLVAEMEAAGVMHGNISAASIRFGAVGEPILLGFGHAVRLKHASVVSAENDRERVAAVTCLVLSYLATDDATVAALLEWIVALPRPLQPEFLPQLQDRLFDLGEALPLASEDQQRATDSLWPALPRAEAFMNANGPTPARKRDKHQSFGRVSTRLARANAWADGFLAAPPWAVPVARLRLALRAVRPRFWVLGAASAVLLGVTALPLLWAGGSGATALGEADPDSQTTPASGTAPPAAPPVATLPEDPVLALPALLAERDRCIDDLSVVCLEGVDQQDSSALASDRALIAGIEEQSDVGDTGHSSAGEEIRRAAWAARIGEGCQLVERRGDSALVTCGVNSKPASVLMIRSEAGWRVRELLDEE